MAINFPASPSTNDTHTENAITWIFNGTSWNAQSDQVTAASIGLGNVDNTADANKPVSTATQTALDDKQCILDAVSVNNVKSFGAVGDGSTDDTTAIQSAIDDTTSNTIYIPKGTYKITTELLLTRHGLRFMGDGPASTKIIQATTATGGFRQTETQTKWHKFKDFTLEGPENTGSSIGFKMQLNAPLDAENWSGGHSWEGVTVQKFGVAWHCRWTPIVTWTGCRALNCLKGWYMDRVDTPLWLNCVASSNIGGANHMDVGIEVVNGGFTGNVINGEWGNMKRVFDISGGGVHYTITGGNIEDSINDGVIFLGQGVSALIKNIRFSIDLPTVSDSAIILCDADGSNPPKLELGECLWDDSSAWRRIVVRGPNYYQARVNNLTNGEMITYEGGTGTGGSVKLSADPPSIRQWAQTQWQSSTPDSETRNAAKRGGVAYFNVNDSALGQFEHLVSFYRDRDGTHKASSLSNDRLMNVLHTQSSQVSNNSTNDTLLVQYTAPSYRVADGETVTMSASGKFAANSNSKRLRVNFSNNYHFDTGNLTHNDRAWVLESKLIRRVHSLVMTTTLLVDGANPIVKVAFPTGEFANVAHIFNLVANATSTGDIQCEQAEIVWRKSQGTE